MEPSEKNDVSVSLPGRDSLNLLIGEAEGSSFFISLGPEWREKFLLYYRKGVVRLRLAHLDAFFPNICHCMAYFNYNYSWNHDCAEKLITVYFKCMSLIFIKVYHCLFVNVRVAVEN